MTPYETQLATVAGCIEYLSGKPKCRVASRELLKMLRKEYLKLLTESETAATPVMSVSTPRRSSPPFRTALTWVIEGLAFFFFIAYLFMLFCVAAA